MANWQQCLIDDPNGPVGRDSPVSHCRVVFDPDVVCEGETLPASLAGERKHGGTHARVRDPPGAVLVTKDVVVQAEAGQVHRYMSAT